MTIVTRPLHQGEPDLLAGKEHQPLIFVDLDGKPLQTQLPPVQGWTHDDLEEVAASISDEIYLRGWDAYLHSAHSNNWIGSSEV